MSDPGTWATDPSRCDEQDCMEEGTEPWGDGYVCLYHFQRRAVREIAEDADKFYTHQGESNG